jgi:outer membrane protein assembly factor BamD
LPNEWAVPTTAVLVKVLDFARLPTYNLPRLEPDPLRTRRQFLSVFPTLIAVVLLLGGCSAISDLLKPRPQALLPAADLYAQGEKELDRSRYAEARIPFKKIVERHPQSSYAPRARFLIGESYYRESEWDKAIKEFEFFLSFYPRHQIADLVQFRLAMSYYDQMKAVEQDQAITAKAMEAFRKLVREYPESRYAADALAKIDICRGRLAQKELWVASYYLSQGNPAAARQRLENVIKDYPRTLVIPEALYRLGEVYAGDGRPQDAQEAFRRVATEYSYTEWGRRAIQRLKTAAR